MTIHQSFIYYHYECDTRIPRRDLDWFNDSIVIVQVDEVFSRQHVPYALRLFMSTSADPTIMILNIT